MRSPREDSSVATIAGWPYVGAVIGLLALSTALGAQTLPLPTLPEEPPRDADPTTPAAGPATGAVASPTRPPPWEYALGAGLGYESNIDFQVPDGPSSVAASPRARLARLFWSPRGELRLGGTGSFTSYRDEKDLNRHNVGFNLAGSYRSSPNTTWRADASYGSGYSDSSQVLVDQGVLLPRVKTRTFAGALGVTRKLGLRTSFWLDGRVYRVEFDETDALGLVNGQSLRAMAGLERRLGVRDTTSLVYALESTLGRPLPEAPAGDGGRYYLTHFGSLQWSHLLSPRSGLLFEAGASYTADAAQAGLEQEESFHGGATFTRRVRRSDVSLFARREVTPAFGLAVSRIENRFGLSATIPMGRAWTLQVAGTHVKPVTPEGRGSTYATPDEASLVLGCRLGRHFEISSEGRYRRRGATVTSPEIETYQVGLFLSLVSPRREGPSVPRPGR